MRDFDKLKKFKYVYLHPHGIGDLIISMPYIREVMENEDNFALCVRDDIYHCGFFNNFNFKNRIFGECPFLWNNLQTFKNFKRINKLCEELQKEKVQAFYLNFNKKENRRRQIYRGLSEKLNQQIPFREDIQGEVYLSEKDISLAQKTLGDNICFFHTRSGSSLKSVIPHKLARYVDAGKFFLFYPFQTDNINFLFAAQLLSKKNIVVDSVYLHSAAALNKDIDVLFVSATVKRFFDTLMPSNIKIHKIIYGKPFDAMRAFFYYEYQSNFTEKLFI